MTTHLASDRQSRPASPGQLAWLRTELEAWRREGLVDDELAGVLAARYHESRRFSVGRLLLTLGGVFVGVGLIWLVAANLDALPPLTRFVAVTVLWLCLLGGGETLAERQREPTGVSRPLVLSVRTMAALGFGAVVFQAAQSLQVPAYEPRLVGLWAAGAFLHAYLARALGPLVVALAAGSGWYLWQTVWERPSEMSVVLALGLLGVLGLGAATLHGRDTFAGPWRELGAVLALASLFAAALPWVGVDGFEGGRWLVLGAVAAGAVSVTALVRGPGGQRLEPLAALGVVAVGVLLVRWETSTDVSAVGAAEWAHAAVSVGAYVVVAVGVALLGTLHDSWRLTAIATAALVVFTTFQSFAVFAPVIQGAWLFVVLGLVFVTTGFLFDRARRELAGAIEGGQR